MPPFAQVYERFAYAMHARVTRDATAKVAAMVAGVTPDTASEVYQRVFAEYLVAAKLLCTALQDFVGMHQMGMLDDMDIDESDTDDTATSFSI